MIDAKKLKKDFPILSGKVVYLDNAATTQKPREVISSVKSFYEKKNANIHRGLYSLSMSASKEYDTARQSVASFINARFEEVIFTRGTTESINLLSYTLQGIIAGRKKILLTELEHHSNLVPWQELAKREGYALEFVKLKDDYTLDVNDLKKKLDQDVAVFSFSAVSNSLGTLQDVELFCKLARAVGAISVVDAAQLAPYHKIDVKRLGCDFLAFSSHKMLGPSGVGVLYGRAELLQMMPPFNTGGGMISEVSYDKASFAEIPNKFEAGTPNIEGAVGLAHAIAYLEKIGMDDITAYESKLLGYALKNLKTIKHVEVYTSGIGKSAGIISFNVKGVHPHDVASLLDDYHICVRAGHHCNMPLMKKLGLPGTVRASFYFYNNKEDVDALVSALKKVVKVFY